MKRPQSAPSWICVLRVPEESKLKTMFTWSRWAVYRAPISVSASSREAAAKTTTSSPPSLPPQAVRTSSRNSRAHLFTGFIVVLLVI